MPAMSVTPKSETTPSTSRAGMRPVVLLGPQRLQPTVRRAADTLDLDGPIALITAGWEEREAEDQELADHLGRQTVNLELFARTERVFDEDPELYEALMQRKDRLAALQGIYRMRLDHALEAARALFKRTDEAEVLIPERQHALDAVAALDAHHLSRVREIETAFRERWKPLEREALAKQREEVHARLDECSAVAIAGGHVMVLLNRFRLYALMPKLTEFPVLAWAAGAMVLTERIVAFHDSPPQGRGNPEVLEAGVGLVPGVVVLPHARQRLKLTDPVRVALLARRFAPARCLAFDADCEAWWVDWRLRPGGGLRELRSQGDVLTLTPASDVGTRRP